MTDIGYKNIIDRINNFSIEPPKNITVKELTAWLNGYAKCHKDVLDILDELRKGSRD